MRVKCEFHHNRHLQVESFADILLNRIDQEKRAINHQASTLEDGLEMLPLPYAKAEEEVTVPVTGQDIRDLDGELIPLPPLAAQR